jgi:predicted TIM-barrel fold metal-dependent hydrolase
MSTHYLVVSADGHAGPPAHVYRDYRDPAFRDAFDAHQAAVEAGRMTNEAFVAEWDEETGDHELLAAYDSDVRDKVLDTEGVAAEVLFPDADVLGTGRTASSPFGSGLASGVGEGDPAQVFAGARAHNRWLADFVRQSPVRRIGVAVVPITAGVEESVAEIRSAADLGLKGVMIPTRWFDQPAYLDPVYEPVWAACAEAGLVVHTHSGAGPADYTLGPGFVSIYAAEAWWWAARPLWVLLLSGVFERHPTLRYSIAENGAWWLPDLAKRMDEKWVGAHNTRKFGDVFRHDLSMRPSEYLRRNCVLAASTPGPDEIERRHEIGVGNLIWGNDLPHPEGTYPHTRRWINERFAAVPRDEARRILGENAADLYGLDRAALAPIVERIGPTVDEVHVPSTEALPA